MIMRRRETPENVHVAHSTECAHVAASSVTNGIRRDDPDFGTINFTSTASDDAHLCLSTPLDSTDIEKERERGIFILFYYFTFVHLGLNRTHT